MSKKTSIVDTVIKALGGPSKAARALGTKPSVVMNWRTRKQVPYDRVLDIEAATGISRHTLRPDIFGAASSTEGAAA